MEAFDFPHALEKSSMDRQFGDARYTSIFVEDRMKGFGGYELMRIRNGNKTRIAQVLYWDACRQFFVNLPPVLC